MSSRTGTPAGAFCCCKRSWGEEIEDEQALTRRVEAMNAYSGFLLAGYAPGDGPLEHSAMAVFEGLMADAEEGKNDPARRDARKIDSGCAFLRFCLEHIESYDDLAGGEFLRKDGPLRSSMLAVSEDHQACLRDLSRGARFVVRLPHRGGEVHKVDGLRLERPTARLFKFWARGDREHSPSGAGFTLLLMQWEPGLAPPLSSGVEAGAMSDATKEHLVFVYGTLRKGGNNHHYLRTARFLGQALTCEQYALLSGRYPYVQRSPKHLELPLARIMGEVYGLDDTTLQAVDELEDHPEDYCRELVDVEFGDGSRATAWLYFHPAPEGEWIPCGDYMGSKD